MWGIKRNHVDVYAVPEVRFCVFEERSITDDTCSRHTASSQQVNTRKLGLDIPPIDSPKVPIDRIDRLLQVVVICDIRLVVLELALFVRGR